MKSKKPSNGALQVLKMEQEVPVSGTEEGGDVGSYVGKSGKCWRFSR